MGRTSARYFKPGKRLQDLYSESVDETAVKSFISSVNSYMRNQLGEYNERDIEQIQKHIETLLQALEKDISGSIQLLYGGSVKKHTYVDGLSDVDVLVTVSDSSLGGKSPAEVLGYFYDRIKNRLPKSEVRLGDLAVTVRFSSGHEIQMLPCLETNGGFRLPSATANLWSNVVYPQRFARKLTEVNQRNNNLVVPVIKLFKSLNNTIRASLSGYHIESLAIAAFRDYSGDKNYYAMLNHLISYSQTAVLTPIRDSTGQSIHVDDYLGQTGSIERKRVAKKLERMSNRSSRNERERDIHDWENIL